jgi:hypothetical protein
MTEDFLQEFMENRALQYISWCEKGEEVGQNSLSNKNILQELRGNQDILR